jgi:hypothetical protein
LERVAAAAFGLSSLLTALAGASAWPGLLPDLIIAEGHLRLFQVTVIFSTTLGLSIAWLLPRRSIFLWCGLLAVPLLGQHVLGVFRPAEAWPRPLSALAGGYLILSVIAGLNVLVRSANSRSAY